MHNRLIVGFDGSTASASGLRWAADEATRRGASVRVVASYAMPPIMDYFGIGLATATATELEAIRLHCLASLGTHIDAMRRDHPSIAFEFEAVNRDPAGALVEAAAEADLLVVGSSGAGAAKSFLLGTVAAEVLHRSPCPVVVVPPEPQTSAGRIVAGVDGSDHSQRAVQWAADEAARRDCDLVVVHAWRYPYRLTPDGFARGSSVAEADAAQVLERSTEIARDRTLTNVTGELIEEGAADALITASTSSDLVVMGTRGRGGFRSMLLGSVTLAVTARAHCPVAVVR